MECPLLVRVVYMPCNRVTSHTLCSPRNAVCTQPYLAPELVRDLPYGAAVDLWAIGVVTFELLHGYTPFR